MPRQPPTGSLGDIERGRRFEPVVPSVRAARDFVAATLDAAEYPGDAEAVVLLVSELVTNAVRHAGTPFEVTIDVGSEGVHVTVVDGAGNRPPKMRQPSPQATSGRGLLIVDQLAEDWGTAPAGAGHKAVWFTIA